MNTFISKLITDTIYGKVFWELSETLPTQFNHHTKSTEKIYTTSKNGITIYLLDSDIFMTDDTTFQNGKFDNYLISKLFKTVDSIYDEQKSKINNMFNRFFN